MLFLLTFIGQATASSLMAYKMAGNMMKMSHSMTKSNTQTTSKSMMNMKHDAMANMNHAEMTLVDNDSNGNSSVDNENSQSDCCQTHCNCFVNGCAFAALITDFYIQQPLVISTTKFYSPLLVDYNQQSKSLYRPPILS